VGIIPAGIPSEEAFGRPVIQGGAVIIQPVGIGSAEEFGTPALSLQIIPAGIGTEEKFGTPVITAGPVAIRPVGIPSEEVFGTPALIYNQDIIPGGIETEEDFGIPTLTRREGPEFSQIVLKLIEFSSILCEREMAALPLLARPMPYILAGPDLDALELLVNDSQIYEVTGECGAIVLWCADDMKEVVNA